MAEISNVKPPPLLADAAPQDAVVRAPAANPPAAQPAWGSVLDALREADETLATVLTGVDNQASAQTLLQVQQGQQQAGAQGALASSLVKNEANARLQAISRMV